MGFVLSDTKINGKCTIIDAAMIYIRPIVHIYL